MLPSAAIIDVLFVPERRVPPAGQPHLLEALASCPPLGILRKCSGSAQVTQVLQLTPEQGLWVDLWPGSELPTPLQAGELLLCWGQLRETPTGFFTHVRRSGRWQGYSALCLELPQSFFQLQRRATLRAAPETPVPVEIQRRGARSLQGMVRDWGGGGLGIAVPVARDYPLTLAEALTVTFPWQGAPYTVQARVCHQAGPRREGGIVLQDLGLAFVDAHPRLSEGLVQAVMRRHRRALRHATF